MDLFRLEKTSKTIESNQNQSTAKSTSKPCAKCQIYTSFNYLQAWSFYHFPGQPVPELGNLLSAEIFPNVQFKTSLA